MQPIEFHFSYDDKSFMREKLNIWFLDMGFSDAEIKKEFLPLLAKEEIEKGKKFSREQLKNQYYCARGLLRKILGDILNIVPEAIEFENNKYGKPFLASQFKTDLRFNLSHSENIFMLGVIDGGDIGVDIEFHHPEENILDLAAHSFAESETEFLRSISSEQEQAELFFRFWVAKEAISKAIGSGMSFGLQNLLLDINPKKEVYLKDITGNFPEAYKFTHYDLSPLCKKMSLFSGKMISSAATIMHHV